MTAEKQLTILVTGDRDWHFGHHGALVLGVLEGFRESNPIIVHGAARGVDSIAEIMAQRLKYTVHPHPANWDQYHRAAGPIRNKEMLQEAPDIVLAFHDNLTASKGTRDMVNQALKAGVPTIININSAGERTIIKEKV